MRRPHSASLMRRLASQLERGTLCSPGDATGQNAGGWRHVTIGCRRLAIAPAASVVSRAWARIADPVRDLPLPAGAKVVGIGGATLGGSGKTPLVLTLAERLAQRGARVAVVASGYRCRLSAARRVRPEDRAALVGDEALWLCRALSARRVSVVCGPRRDAAIALAAELSRLVIVDGLLQARPRPVDLSVLVLDAARPWGAMRCPPAGDLRARPERLLEAADVSVLVGNPPLEDDLPERTYRVRTALFGAETADGERMSIDRLRAMRLGLVLGVARPERILEALSENGIEPCTTRLYADHSPMTQIGETYSPRPPEAWLTTAKCATKLAERLAGAAVLTLDHRLSVPDALLERVAALG